MAASEILIEAIIGTMVLIIILAWSAAFKKLFHKHVMDEEPMGEMVYSMWLTFSFVFIIWLLIQGGIVKF